MLRGATGRLWQIQVQRSRIVTLKPARAWCSSAPLDGASGTEQTACDRPAGATEIGRSDWEPWVHSQGSLLFSGERPATAGATVDGTRTGAVVESSVELTPSPHGSFLRHYHGPVFPHAARYFRRAVSPKISRGDRAASFLRMPNLTRGRDAKGRLLATWSESSDCKKFDVEKGSNSGRLTFTLQAHQLHQVPRFVD